MNSQRQKNNWWLDAVLLGGFLLAMLLDVTGLELHQWLGITLPVLAGYHLVRHWQWVKTVSGRLFGRTSASARRAYMVDVGLMVGLLTIGLTGLVISTWLDLSLTNYPAWRTLHVWASVVTLGLVVLKVGLHWRWIVATARRHIAPPVGRPTAQGDLAPAAVTVRRRDFIQLMGAVGAISVVAGAQALSGKSSAAVQSGEPASTDSVNTASASTASAGSVQSDSTSCTVACGRRCSYPGQCRRYQDANGNGRCDLGECSSGSGAADAGAAGSSATGATGGTIPYGSRRRRGG